MDMRCRRSTMMSCSVATWDMRLWTADANDMFNRQGATQDRLCATCALGETPRSTLG
jgi:hypothetical protein